MAEIPAEAGDHGILWSTIQSNSTEVERQALIANTTAEVTGIRDIRRVVPGSGDYIMLQLPGTLNDYPDDLLDTVAGFVTDGINNLKAHPDGWSEVNEAAAL
jgi:hypothetical protein